MESELEISMLMDPFEKNRLYLRLIVVKIACGESDGLEGLM